MIAPFLALSGCAWLAALGTSEVELPPMALPPPHIDGPVWTARVVEAPVARPAGLDGEVPPSLRALADAPDAYPSLDVVAHRVCVDADGARQAVARAIANAAPDDRAGWAAVMADCGTPSFCAWVADGLESGPPDSANPLWAGVLRCDTPQVESLVQRAEAPDDVVVRWTWRHGRGHGERLEQATVATLQEPGGWAAGLYGLMALEVDADPEAGRSLQRIHGRVHTGFRDAVAYAMWGRDDPALGAMHRRACQRNAVPSCGRRRLDPLADLDAAVRSADVDLDDLIADHPSYTQAIVTALKGCVAEGDPLPYTSEDCLRAWASLDRPAAAEAAQGAQWEGEVQRTLARYPTPGALQDRLQSLGFAVASEGDPVVAMDVLLGGGAAIDVSDVETMASLLRQLLALSGADDVPVRVQVPFPTPEHGDRLARVAVFAWVDGTRLRSLSDSFEGEPDVRTAVAFVNAVLERREDEVRVALVDWPSAVVAGTPAALTDLEDEGLVSWAEPPVFGGFEEADTGLP